MLKLNSIPESSRKEVSDTFPLIEGRQPLHVRLDAEKAAAVARGDVPPTAPRYYTRPQETEQLLCRRNGEQRGRRFTDNRPSAWGSL